MFVSFCDSGATRMLDPQPGKLYPILIPGRNAGDYVLNSKKNHYIYVESF